MNVQTDRVRVTVVSAVLAITGLALLFHTVPPGDPDGQMQLQEAGRLPVVDGGRVKPLDTFARTQLMLASGKQTYQDAQDKSQPAVRWLFDTMAAGLAKRYEDGPTYATIEDPKLAEALGLRPNPAGRYPIAAFHKKLAERVQPLEKLDEKDGVFVVADRRAVFRPVKTGIMGDTDVEIMDGLAEGEEIVTGSYRTLRTLKDGAVLKVEPPKQKS